jgi:hypothetical protein
MILGLVLVLGVAAGLLAGGRLGLLSEASLKGAWLLIVLFVAQAALPLVRTTGTLEAASRWTWLLTFPVMVVVAAVNWRESGMPLMSVGLLLNTLVIAANGAMPVSMEAALAVGGTATGSTPAASDFAHVLLTAATRLPWLADVIPTAGPRGLAVLLSPGDIVLFAGLMAYLARSMTVKPPGRHAL